MINKWNNSDYGQGVSTDVWGKIEDRVSQGWFVPSRQELAAFVDMVEKMATNYSDYAKFGIQGYYWSSSQYGGPMAAYCATFLEVFITYRDSFQNAYVRLSTTF